MAELRKEIMQQWNKGQADQRGIENLGPWILSLTASDQSKSQIFFLSFSFFYMTISAQWTCRALIELMINFSELMITIEVVTFLAL